VSSKTRTVLQMLEYMAAQNEAWPFREPVKAEEVPDYYTLVKVLVCQQCTAHLSVRCHPVFCCGSTDIARCLLKRIPQEPPVLSRTATHLYTAPHCVPAQPHAACATIDALPHPMPIQ